MRKMKLCASFTNMLQTNAWLSKARIAQHVAGARDPGSSESTHLDLGKGVATLRQQHVERAFTALQRTGLCHGNRGRCCKMRPVCHNVFALPAVVMIVSIVQLVRGLRPGPITLVLRALASRLILRMSGVAHDASTGFLARNAESLAVQLWTGVMTNRGPQAPPPIGAKSG